jgi:hypothetical protein
VKQLLADYDFSDKLDDVKRMYDGYNFGGFEIYNPWSLLNCIHTQQTIYHWINTSSNDLLKDLCQNASIDDKKDLEVLLEKGSIQKFVDDNIVFPDIKKSNVLWSFMLMNGYLRYDNLVYLEDNIHPLADLTIPNREIYALFISDIAENWFDRTETTDELESLADLLVYGDLEVFKKEFKDFCFSSFSYYDVGGEEPELFYHAFTLGMLACLKDKYKIKSNRESGKGRYDVLMVPRGVWSSPAPNLPQRTQRYTENMGQWTENRQQTTENSPRGIIIEFKTVNKKRGETFEKTIARAKKQMAEKHYVQDLKDEGVKNIVYIIAAFESKEVEMNVEWIVNNQ